MKSITFRLIAGLLLTGLLLTVSPATAQVHNFRLVSAPGGGGESSGSRFKITGSGKVMRRGAGKRHLLQTKSAGRRRSLGKDRHVSPTDAYRITQNLPFSH